MKALTTELEAEKQLSASQVSQIALLNQQIAALRRQLAALEDALDTSEKRDRESQTKIADLGQRLNLALAQRVQELQRYRSEFFGRLREILGNRPDIRVVGDRFVFQSEVLFDVGSAGAQARSASRARQARRRPGGSREQDSRPTSPGCCASTATPTCGRSPPRSSLRTGSCPPPAPSRWCST